MERGLGPTGVSVHVSPGLDAPRMSIAFQAENRIASVALGGLMVLPLLQIAARRFLHAAIPGEAAIVSTLTLWLGMLGAAIAARDGKLLTLATGEFLPKGRVGAMAHLFGGAVGALIATILAAGAVALVQSDRVAGDMLTPQIPVWAADLVLPIGFSLIAIRLAWHASPSRTGRAVAALGIVAGVVINHYRAGMAGHALTPWLVLVLAAGVLGAPIFTL